MFNEQPPGISTAQAARQAVEKTHTVLAALEIPQDSLIHQYKWASHGFSGRFTAGQVGQLRDHPLVDFVAKDFAFKAFDGSAPEAPASKAASNNQITPWGVSRVFGPILVTENTAWILDSGIDLDHPDLNVNTSLSTSFLEGGSGGPGEELDSPDDPAGHGTSVAGVVAAIDNNRDVVGVAAGASVVAVRVCNEIGQCFVSDVIKGVDYVADHFSIGDVANLSLGYPTEDNENRISIDTTLTALENTITNAAEGGVKFSISAGNESDDANLHSPARLNHANIWTVSAFRQGDEFVNSFDCISGGSNFGNPPIDFSAPGENITTLTIDGGVTTTCGTSFSTAYVTGILLTTTIASDGTVSNDPDGNPDPIAVADIPPPPSVTIDGPTDLLTGQQGTWTADVTDGLSPFSYQWKKDGSNVGTDSDSYTDSFQNAGTHTIEVTVTDAVGRTTQDTHTVEVQGEIGF